MCTGQLSSQGDVRAEETQAVLAACRVLVAVSARSIAAVENVADLTQVRALMVIAGRGAVTLSELAAATDIHLTRASRLCDRLVMKGLINRGDDPTNRRQLQLTLTPSGARVVRRVTRHRQAAIDVILARMTARMSDQCRADVVALLREFAAAGGEPSELDLWSMGWMT